MSARDLPLPARSFRQCAHRAGAAARSGAARRRDRPGRICSEEHARAELAAAKKIGVSLVAPGKPAIRRGWRRSTTRRLCSACGALRLGPDAADDRDRRLAQCFRRRVEIRRPAGARSRRGRFCRHLRAGARHRSGRASRDCRAARSRCWPAGMTGSIRPSMRTCSPHCSNGRRDFRNAARPCAARPRFSAAQPADLGRLARRRRGRGRAPLGLADHGADGRRTGPRSVCGAGLAARSARRRHQRPDQAGRDAGHGSHRRHQRGRADHGAAGRARGAEADDEPLDVEPIRANATASSICSGQARSASTI